MTWSRIVLLLLVTAFLQAGARQQRQQTSLQQMITLAKQVSKQQFLVEEQAREQGQSGVKVMRLRNQGTLPFYGSTHTDEYTTAAIHDHPEYFNTCGMGELEVALNGIHFKTRHNDYKLVRKADVGCGYDDTVPIPYPEVPPSVTGSVEEQIEEMQNYFQAFAMQEPMLRDYQEYFKPNKGPRNV